MMKDKIHLSLWLIPPGGEGTEDDENGINDQHKHKYKQHKHNVYKSAKDIVDELAEEHNGPKFIPHITVVGGIEVDSEEDAIQMSKKLKEGLASSNNNSDDTTTTTTTSIRYIDCQFKSIGGVEGTCCCWNQAVILKMERSESFVKLCQVCRQLVGMEQQQQQPHLGLGGVVGEVGPHMSLYYGVPPNIPDLSTIDVSRIFPKGDGDTLFRSTCARSFQSHRVMLVKTDPSTGTIEDVPNWKTIADIDLLA